MDSTVGGLNELAEKIRQYKLKQILGVDDFSILIWKHPQKTRPREASYIILKYRDDCGDTISTEAAYEKGKFWYFYPDGSSGEINEKVILGWDYFPYNEELPQVSKEETESP